jgi:hypothetical protein
MSPFFDLEISIDADGVAGKEIIPPSHHLCKKIFLFNGNEWVE